MTKFSMSPAKLLFAALLAGAAAGSSISPAQAVVCANGVYRAGCAGPHGAVGVNKYPYAHPGYGHPYYRPAPYYHGGGCYWSNGVKICR